jgi:hypothetical protein
MYLYISIKKQSTGGEGGGKHTLDLEFGIDYRNFDIR